MDQILDLFKKPFIYFSKIPDELERYSNFEGIIDMKKSIPTRMLQAIQDFSNREEVSFIINLQNVLTAPMNRACRAEGASV